MLNYYMLIMEETLRSAKGDTSIKAYGLPGVFAPTCCHGIFHEYNYILQIKIVMVSIH